MLFVLLTPYFIVGKFHYDPYLYLNVYIHLGGEVIIEKRRLISDSYFRW